MEVLLNKFPSLATLFFSLFVLFYDANGLIKLPPNITIPAIFVFGDSIVDSGNNNEMVTQAKANFRPYGRDFQGGVPTGRFSNGKVPSDLLAEVLGIKDSVPAYLDPKLKPEDLVTGVNFASGGTGFDPMTPQLAPATPLPQQLEYLKEYIRKLTRVDGEGKTKFILANSLFLLVAGSNDIANTYFLLRLRQYQYDIASYADLMLSHASTFLKDLYNLGARRIVVFSAPPLGCLPSQRTLGGGIERNCVEDYNHAAQLFNSKLIAELDCLNAELPNSGMIYLDVYTPLLDIIQNPSKYGFEVATQGCCGTGYWEAAATCNPLTPATCANSSSYVFWDSYHPTERTYGILINQLVPKYINKLF